jgi:Ca-activated chloride channel family protein
MRFRYRKWDEELAQQVAAFQSLMALYQHLLLQTNGDPEEALHWLRVLQDRGYLSKDIDIDEFERSLEQKKMIERRHGAAVLTRRGERSIREESLALIFSTMKRGTPGEHPTRGEGPGSDSTYETRPYSFGDPLNDIDFRVSLNNALKRSGIDDISLSEEDLEVFEREAQASCATVLMLDISHSMILYGEDRITPAKRVALALAELITTRFPKDSLDVVLFGDEARWVSIEDLPYVGVGPFHTNTKAGLQMAQQILRRRKHAQKQIFMITDGKPSALTLSDGRLYKNSFGLDEMIVNRTLDEAWICRRNRIPITTFMIAQDHYLVEFVEEFTEINKGRAYYASSDALGGYIFVDFVKNRRRRVY